jgi:RimJ/RimL family protein N-acetyltransferase
MITERSAQSKLINCPPEPAEYLKWDSEFFGFRIGRVHSGPFDPIAINQWRQVQQIRCLYYLVNLDDVPSIHAAENMGFQLMDIRSTFSLQLPQIAYLDPDLEVRQAEPWELPHLLEISTGIFCNARFYQDPHFSTQRVDQMYNRWLENHFQQSNTCIWVAEDENGILGFTSVEVTQEGIVRLSLTGVQPSARRRGAAKAIKNFIIDHYSKLGCVGLESITQGRNRSLININNSFGFRLVQQQLWYHGWFLDD